MTILEKGRKNDRIVRSEIIIEKIKFKGETIDRQRIKRFGISLK